MKIKGVAFDIEGTVVNLEPAHHAAHIETAKEVGVILKDVEEAVKKVPHFIGGPDSAIAEGIWGLSDKQKSVSFILERDQYYFQKFLKETPIVPRPGFLKVLKDFQDLGMKTSLGSYTSMVHAIPYLNSSGLDRVFSRDITVLREDVKNIKPAPDVFLETARRMGVNPGEQLVFEDSPRGVAAGVAAGSVVIGMPVYNFPQAIDSLKDAGVIRVYLSWEEIDIEELLNFLDKKV